ncbi:GNAT family N-acetyltransferase [Noviherbaspirillum galbum]|uniref:GNAT family N-acetyltransferase n=1 Tax=Noviherbaspirillum galbum TaxID=2709383 RepID=A0A6B3SS23_9BURK|nr:GNAT family N-acetyltransferase [Noviherbaspirillum galbum]NEX63484.1 GNAT family N-acetyltransferase [Noviherbaspirillum galbum]
MHTPEIRRLLPADADAYRTLMLQAYAAHPEAFTASVDERAAFPMSWWETRVGAGEDSMEASFGAFDGAALVGAVSYRREPRPKSRHKASLLGMFVQPAARHGGTGKALVQALLRHARGQAGLRVVQLTVSEGNEAAQRLYERCGFSVFGVEPLAMREGERYIAKVHMWTDLAAPLPS